MRNQRLCTALFGSLICLLLAGVPVAAQEPHARDPIADNLFAPELVLSNQNAIGLDEAQKTFIRAEVLKAQPRFTELQFQLEDAMEALAGLLKQSPVEEARVVAQLDKVLNSEREIKKTQIVLMVRIKNKLTAEQQGRLRQLRKD